MSRTHKLINLAGIVLPFVGLIAAIVLLWDRMVGPTELAILAVGYLLTGVGITVGYHRLFTHRSFETYRPVRYTFAVLGQMAGQVRGLGDASAGATPPGAPTGYAEIELRCDEPGCRLNPIHTFLYDAAFPLHCPLHPQRVLHPPQAD